MDRSASRTEQPIQEPNVEEVTWRVEAVLAGALGAFVVAFVFLLFDLAARRPFWTPFALGSALFLGHTPAAGAAIDPVLVLGYTAVHALVFVTFGAGAAFQVDTEAQPRTGLARAARIALLLFLGFEVAWLALAVLFAPELIGMLGVGRVALANALAAAAMSTLVCVRAAHGVGTRRMAPG